MDPTHDELFIDFETFSLLDLTEVGGYRYAKDKSTKPLLLSYAFNDDPVQVCELITGNLPDRVAAHVELGGKVIAHGDFDRIIWNAQAYWPHLRLDSYTSTMAMALEVGLPAKLGDCAWAMNLPVRKDTKGKALIKRFCQPTKKGALPNYSGPDWLAFKSYAGTDTEVCRAIYRRLPKLSARERAAYQLDTIINERGIRIDRDGVEQLHKVSLGIVERLNTLTLKASGGKITTIDKLPAMKEWLGVGSITKDTLPDLLAKYPPDSAEHRVLLYRQLGSKASVKKLIAMLATMSPSDDRVRGAVAFCAAHTRRWGGRLIQPQNFPRECFNPEEVSLAIEHARAGYKAFTAAYSDPLTAISMCLRGLIIPRPGHVLLDADYNAIEVRILCWYAGQRDILDLYEAGGDVYMEMARSIGADASRQLGKTIVLGSGYMLGAKKAHENLNLAGFDVTLKEAKHYIGAYRTRFHRVEAFWYALRDAAQECVRTGRPQRVGKVGFEIAGNALVVSMPHGNVLRYYAPRIEWVRAPWAELDDEEPDRIQAITFTDMQGYGMRETLSPGLLTNNIVQSTAREVMLEGMFNVAPHFPIVLTVHDQIVSECKVGEADETAYAAMLTRMPTWANGLPLKAEAKTRRRFGK
jgi:DNA polymerase